MDELEADMMSVCPAYVDILPIKAAKVTDKALQNVDIPSSVTFCDYLKGDDEADMNEVVLIWYNLPDSTDLVIFCLYLCVLFLKVNKQKTPTYRRHTLVLNMPKGIMPIFVRPNLPTDTMYHRFISKHTELRALAHECLSHDVYFWVNLLKDCRPTEIAKST